ncbi:membrane protein [Nesterenkonia sp. AN1]|nr:membrane protein [Nesterenkonia sp. AN1]EXF23904.1 membrane protein [Nesterenkonia sp. AN1]
MGQKISAGVIGGFAGGVVFGILMAMMGMLPMIASMVGSTSAAVGFGVHLVISILLGLGLTIPFGGALRSYGRGAIIGLLYGVLWWVLGALLIMPLMMGMPIFAVNTMALFSLMGHLLYGLILGLIAVAILNRRK